jgi:hypothetical protein
MLVSWRTISAQEAAGTKSLKGGAERLLHEQAPGCWCSPCNTSQGRNGTVESLLAWLVRGRLVPAGMPRRRRTWRGVQVDEALVHAQLIPATGKTPWYGIHAGSLTFEKGETILHSKRAVCAGEERRCARARLSNVLVCKGR